MQSRSPAKASSWAPQTLKRRRMSGLRRKRTGTCGGFVPNAGVPIKSLGEISRYWAEFGIPDQVVVMQAKYDKETEKLYRGRHNLWTFKVLSNIMPMSRFLKSAPSSETFVAFDLAREALSDFTPKSSFGSTLAIAALAASEGVPVDDDMVHADNRDLLRMLRGLNRSAADQEKDRASGSASGSEAGAGPPLPGEEQHEQRASAMMARQDCLNGRMARASILSAAVQVEKERVRDGSI